MERERKRQTKEKYETRIKKNQKKKKRRTRIIIRRITCNKSSMHIF